jgi:hypothetical protein
MSELLVKLDNWSDKLSPMVVKEVRQLVRGKEFGYSFGLALVAGLLVAFFGLASSGTMAGGNGASVFTALMVCLMLLGLVVVPLGALNALRVERSDHTLDLITQTSLTPRRIVIGKLLAQGIKLVILFAGLGPFVAMSFLLGGIDLTSILTALVFLFLWSIWVSAMCLFVSATSASRAVSGILFAVMTVLFIGVLGRFSYLLNPLLGFGGFPGPGAGFSLWWMAAISTMFCLITMANLVLLAENRLSLPIEDRSTALRVGFFIQFLFIVGCVVGARIAGATGFTPSDAITALGIFGGIDLSLVAIFSTTEDMALSRRVIRDIKPSLSKPWLAIFRPGGGRATQWLLAQMIVLLVVGGGIVPIGGADFRWLIATCGYVCFFSGVPAYFGRSIMKARAKSSHLRAFTFIFLPVVTVSADLLQYFFKTDDMIVNGTYSFYHILNPFRTLANWGEVESGLWDPYVYFIGIIGVVSYVMLIRIGHRETRNASILDIH